MSNYMYALFINLNVVKEDVDMLDSLLRDTSEPSFVSRLSLLGINWIYRGEGNANLVISLPQRREILRLHKIDQNARAPNARTERERVLREILFCQHVMVPLVGACYLQPSVAAKLDPSEIQQINYLLCAQRPANRRHKVVAAGGYVTLHPDYTLLPSSLADPDSDVPTFCVEIKPKQGWMPPRKAPTCTFCTKQFLKLKNKAVNIKSTYCPLDLFSGDLIRMRRALKSLLATPQNNLKIFKNGQLAYGEGHENFDSLFEVLQSWFGCFHKNRLLNLFSAMVVEALTRDLSGGTLAPLTAYPRFFDYDTNKVTPVCDPRSLKLPTNCVLDRVSDLDPKPVSCIQKHRQRDRATLQAYEEYMTRKSN